MNALGAVSSWLTSQNVFGDLDNFQIKTDSQTQGSKESESFFSVLKLLDTNADGNIGTDELKFGAGFMINSMVYGRDTNGDEMLSAEEVGVSPGIINAFDTNGDQNLGAGEIITPANKIIDGLVSLLDLDGNQLLSNQEMAIIELLFSAIPSFNDEESAKIGSVDQALDLNTIPDRMRQAGFEGRDNALYYALASSYAGNDWGADPADLELVKLAEQKDQIVEWFDKIMNNVSKKMEDNPDLKMTAIVNDGPDRLGFRLGSVIMQKLDRFGDRVQMGTAYEESA